MWHLQANDNSLGGWLATCAYAALIVMCWREVLLPVPAGTEKGRALKRPFWIWFALGVTAVGFNKQLDLQTWLIEFGRKVARSVGMMQYRRLFQAGLAVTAALAAAVLVGALWRFSKQSSRSERLVIIGACGLVGFLVLRIATLNHLDILTEEMAPQRLVPAVELAIVSFLCLVVWRNRQTDSSRSSTR